jgi:L-amino acid N-acyltransferase YncA
MPNPAEGVRIEAMTSAHAAAFLAIYQAGIDEGNATFETRAPDCLANSFASVIGAGRR